MNRLASAKLVFAGLITVSVLADGIPEPPAILHGVITIDGRAITSTDDVAVTAWVDGVADPVGTYQMGENQGIGDSYAMVIRLESLANNAAASLGTARIGHRVRMSVREGSGSELPAASTVIDERGSVSLTNLAVTVAPDVDGDLDGDLRDFAVLQRCFTGPNGALDGDCTDADLDRDTDVDLGDVSTFVVRMTGPS